MLFNVVLNKVEYHTELEEKLPQWILARIDEQSLTVYPNKKDCEKRNFIMSVRFLSSNCTIRCCTDSWESRIFILAVRMTFFRSGLRDHPR